MGGVELPYEMIMHRNLDVCKRFVYQREHIVQVIKLVERDNLLLGRQNSGVKGEICGLDQFEAAMNVAAEKRVWGSQVILQP